MFRSLLLTQLMNYQTYDQKEEADRLGLIELVKNYDDCFERLDGKCHITASAWIENNEGTAFVLLLHKKLNIWLHPGGHTEGDSNLHYVAQKEALEETGLSDISSVNEGIFDIDSYVISCAKNKEPVLHYDVRFLFKCGSFERFNDCEERIDIRWFTELPPNCSHIQRLYEKWLLNNLRRIS